MATQESVMAVIRASRPSFRGQHDKVAFAIHASCLAAGYILTAAGPPAFSDDALSSPSTDEVGVDGWNQTEENYAFVYLYPKKGSKILVKCISLNDKLLVDALSDGDSEPKHLEINVGDYATENGGSNYGTHFKNLDRLVSSINQEILSKGTSSSAYNLPSSDIRGSRSQPEEGTETEDLHPHQPFSLPPVYPTIGGSDLFPGAGAGMYPPRRFRGDFSSGGGNLIGPDHPIFSDRFGGEQPGFPGTRPPEVPPGARFDPYGPPGVPGFEPNRFTRNPQRPGGDIHPDLEQFRDGDLI